MKQLFKRGFSGMRSADQVEMLSDFAAEKAVRSWAAREVDVAAVVASVDADRIAFIAQLLAKAGAEAEQASSRAAFIYWAYLGRNFVMDATHSSISPTASVDISELFKK